MVKVDYDVAIARNPQAVFDYITQVERIPEWQSQAGVTNRDSGDILERPFAEATIVRENGVEEFD